MSFDSNEDFFARRAYDDGVKKAATFTEDDVQAVAELLRSPDHWPSATYRDDHAELLTEEFDKDTHAAAVEICALLKRRIEAR